MMKELESLKAIAESQLIELHNSLRDEREQKHIYKQQLDHRIQQVFQNKIFFFSQFFFFFIKGISSKFGFITFNIKWSYWYTYR
jgi:hypothetical protein